MGYAVQCRENVTRSRLGVKSFAALILTISTMFLVTAASATGKEETKMTNSAAKGSSTYCLGRYTIDTPAGAKMSARFVVGGMDVKTHVGVSEADFKKLVAGREAELSELPYKHGGSLFKERLDFEKNRIFLTSWSTYTSRRTSLVELYSLMQQHSVVHVFSGKADADKTAGSRDYAKKLSETLVYRSAHDIPQQAGFCIDRALVTRSVLNKEEANAAIRLPTRPSVGISYMSYVTGKPDEPLLSRVSRVPPGYEGTLASMKTLRRGDRNIGPIKGQEFLVRGSAGGKRSYEFLWESQGEEDSIEFPFQSLRLTTTDEVDDEGEIIDAPFESDADALALWDSILGSLRLRPGAIGPAASK